LPAQQGEGPMISKVKVQVLLSVFALFSGLGIQAADVKLEFVAKILSGLTEQGDCRIDHDYKSKKTLMSQAEVVNTLYVQVHCNGQTLEGTFYELSKFDRRSVQVETLLVGIQEIIKIEQSYGDYLESWDAETFRLELTHDGQGSLLKVDFKRRGLGDLSGYITPIMLSNSEFFP
jgi:hypothetical protein